MQTHSFVLKNISSEQTESCDQSSYYNKLHRNATANAKTVKWSRGNKRHIGFLIIKAFCFGKMLHIKPKWDEKSNDSHMVKVIDQDGRHAIKC